MNKYLKFEYWDTCDLGNIYYQGGQHFWFYLDGDVLEPFHEETEDGQENGDGDFIPTYRRGMKRYRIRTGLVPDYMVDAIQRMKLHDHIELTFKTGEIEQVYNVDVEMEWQFEKKCHQATVVLTFDMDEKIVVGACCDNLTVSEVDVYPGDTIPEPVDIGGYYVSTTGDDDTGDGSFDNPWATWQKGFNEIVAGDTLYIRGGIYSPIGTFIYNPFGTDWYACAGANNKSGTALNPIIVRNYPGEVPILDGQNNNAANNGGAGSRFQLLFRRCSYWHLYGLEVRNLLQLTDEIGVGVVRFFDYAHHNRLELLKVHDNGGSGICFLYDCDDNYIINCDSYDNYDHLSVPTPGNNSDGIEIADITVGTYKNYIIGCRMWDNSDDGVDLMRNEGIVIIDKSWAFLNGVTSGHSASGFKLGWVDDDPLTYQREVTNCISAYNTDPGYVCNNCNAKMKIYNNIAVGNDDHGFKWYNARTNGASIIRNNVSYGNYQYQFSYIDAFITFDHNSYDVNFEPTGPVASDADYKSVVLSQLRAARRSDGSLPRVDCYHLTPGSDLVAAGTNVGLAADGDGDSWNATPSIGPFEYK